MVPSDRSALGASPEQARPALNQKLAEVEAAARLKTIADQLAALA
jgi:hypothetical protein